VLHGGRALQRGTHAELITRDGAYARMWKRESGCTPPVDLDRASVADTQGIGGPRTRPIDHTPA
jgi:hypothetical protein